MTEKVNVRDFKVVRFEEGDILLVHRHSKYSYQYSSSPPSNPHVALTHPLLLLPIPYGGGSLHAKGVTSLHTQLQARMRAHTPLHYTEQELVDTFQPILDCLRTMHAEGVAHGALDAHHIIFDHDGLIKLGSGSADNCHSRNSKGEHDIWRWGQVLLEAATLKEVGEGAALWTVVDKYTKAFMFALIILSSKIEAKYSLLQQFLSDKDSIMADPQLEAIYTSLAAEREVKSCLALKTTTKQSTSANQSPVKKPLATPLTKKNSKEESENRREEKQRSEYREERRADQRKLSAHEDSFAKSINNQEARKEGKKSSHEDTKRKQIDKINKIIQRSNQFVSQLMARKNNDQALKKLTSKPNVTMACLNEPLRSKKEPYSPYASPFVSPLVTSPFLVSPFIASPSRKLRAISKKK